MNQAAKNLLRVAGVVAGLGAAAWALRDKMLPPPEVQEGPPPNFRTGGGADDLTLIKGIGPVYRDRLTGVGVHSFFDLAEASASEIAEAAGVSESIAHGWMQAAHARA